MRRLMVIVGIILVLLIVSPAVGQDAAPTLAELIASADDLSVLNELIAAADPALTGWLSQPDAAFTVFAPVDSAWRQYFAETGLTLADLRQQPRRLNDLLRFHLAPLALLTGSETGWLCRDLGTMLPNERILIEWDWQAERFTIGVQAHTLAAPLAAANGVLYRLDRVIPRVNFIDRAGDHTPDDVPTPIPPPTPTAVSLPDVADVPTVLANDGRFTMLLSLLERYPAYLETLTSGGLYLLLAPTDAAFDEFFRPRRALPANFEDLLLSSSIVPGYLTPDLFFEVYGLTSGSYCPLLPGAVLTIQPDGDRITAGGAPLTGETLLAQNVIIYVLDGVQYQQPFQG